LQFAIWTVLLLRELRFRVRYPIPILADNVAAILIAKSPGHTKYARHIALRTHCIRSVLPFRDFILAYIKTNWNFAGLNTKAVTPGIFRRLGLRGCCVGFTHSTGERRSPRRWRRSGSRRRREMMLARWRSTWGDSTTLDAHNERRRQRRSASYFDWNNNRRSRPTNVVGFTSAKDPAPHQEE
jgi:hypothetical protein